jgi:GNAT superfamily N-acetyltransferase
MTLSGVGIVAPTGESSGARCRLLMPRQRADVRTSPCRMIRVREVTDPSDPAIAGFDTIQRQVYFDPGALIPTSMFGRLLAASEGARRNFFLVAEDDAQQDAVLGGTFFHYLAAAGTGFSSFMGVAREARGRGIARQLHAARFEVLQRVANGSLPGVFIDVVNPARLSQKEIERDRAVGSDPWLRLRIFARLGFRRVDVRYEQPVGGPNGGPVTSLDLLFCPTPPADAAALREIPTRLVATTLQAYWTPWLGAREAARHADALAARAQHADRLRLVSPEVQAAA